MKILNYLNSPIASLAIVFVAYFLFLMVRLETHDAAVFVQAGEHFVDTTQTPDNLFTVTPYTGYDGTFYYRIALTPFTREVTAFGITIDNARYRHQRILYPLLGWVFSFGSPPLAIYSLITVNFLALCCMGWLGGLFAKSVGRHALWGTPFALYPGLLFTLSRDLTEIIEALFVLATLVALKYSRYILAMALLILAILAKETSLLVAIAAIIAWFVRNRKLDRNSIPWYVGMLPVLTYILWQIGLELWWRSSLAGATQANIGLPIIGMVEGFKLAASVDRYSQLMWILEVIALAVLAATTLFMLRRSLATLLAKTSWVLYLFLLLVLTSQVWLEDWAFLRAASLFYLFSISILLQSGHIIFRGVVALALGGWAVIAINLLYYNR